MSWTYRPEVDSLENLAKKVDGKVLIVVHWPSRQRMEITKKDIKDGKYPTKQYEYVLRGSI